MNAPHTLVRADYDMSRPSMFNRPRVNLPILGGSADYHYRITTNYYHDIEKARDMARNDSIVGQCIDRAVANIVQDGFTLDPQTGDKSVDDYLFSKWQEWSESPEACDIGGQFTWHDFESQAMRAIIRDGDCAVIGLDSGELQFIEAHAIQTADSQPDTVLGVSKDECGLAYRFWIMQDHIQPYNIAKRPAVPVDIFTENGFRQLFHCYDPKRASQTRGVTALAPVFTIAGMLDDLQFAKLVQQQVAACVAYIIEQTGNNPTGLPTADSFGAQRTQTTSAGTRQMDEMKPGARIRGNPGEKITAFSPDMPSGGYFEQVKLLLQTIGVNIGLPLCLVLMDGSETNFSGWRGAVDEARKGFKHHQRNLVKRLHKPTYEWKVMQWLEEDPDLAAAAVGLNIFGHKWNAPRWPYIDPVSEAQADQTRLQFTQTSRRRLHAEHGDVWEEIVDEQVADNYYAIRAACIKSQQLNAEFPQAATQWFHFINLPMTQTTQMSVQDPKMIAAQQGQAASAGSGEMSQLNRRQFTNNQKAITDLQQALIDGTMSEARVQVGLSALGLSQENVDALIADAKDGSIDNA